ncbi:unnamed protein product [Dibothriocephalus latus]|uniref:Uncharacterized protein n=1 Tax=Dibothriocephalus latus TaxID=60516 RepID=A0A3P7NNE3_DIBLA|nr:unnamed protein product [Dibothriocephalus latus]
MGSPSPAEDRAALTVLCGVERSCVAREDALISSPLPARNFWEIKDHAAMVPESKTKTVVIDVSSYFVRAGVLRNQPNPAEICFPTVTSFRTDFSGTAVGDKVYENLFSEAASQQQMIFPLRQRKIGVS